MLLNSQFVPTGLEMSRLMASRGPHVMAAHWSRQAQAFEALAQRAYRVHRAYCVLRPAQELSLNPRSRYPRCCKLKSPYRLCTRQLNDGQERTTDTCTFSTSMTPQFRASINKGMVQPGKPEFRQKRATSRLLLRALTKHQLLV
jgi:hypothetical protein